MNVMLESEIRDLQDKLRHRPGTMAMRQEAVIRMRLLGIPEAMIQSFEDDNTIVICPEGGPLVLMYGRGKAVADFEAEHKVVVYCIVYSQINGMLLENMLYVSRFQNEWEMEKQELKRRAVLAYVNNISDPDNSEFGHIGISVDLTGKLFREW